MMMRRWLLSCVFLVMCVNLSAAQVRSVVGVNVSGPKPDYPLASSILCNGSAGELDCPQYFSPDWSDTSGERFFGVTNITTPATFVQSLDGGTTWTPGPSNPFAATTVNGTAFALASDGSLIAAADVNGTTISCQIRRSTDQGVSWTTVHSFTNATGFCGAFGTTVMSSPARCALNSSKCIIMGWTGVNPVPIVSQDNGVTWATGATLATIVGSPPFLGASLSDNGVLGISGHPGVQTTTQSPYTDGGISWLSSGVWGGIPGVSHRCTGPVQHNLGSGATLVCGPGSVSPTLYVFGEVTGSVPSVIRTFTLSDAPPSSGSPDANALQWDANTYYVTSRNAAATRTNIYITTDSFVSTHLIGSLLPTNQFTSCCRGDMFKANGRVYFTSGGIGGSAQLFVIQ